MYSQKSNARKNSRIVKAILVSVAVIIGSVFAFVVPGIVGAISADCTEDVTAVVSDMTVHNDDGSTMYSAVYEYEYAGQNYTVESNTQTSWKPELGKSVQLKVNPDDPTDTFNPYEFGLILKIFRIVGYVILGIGVITLFIPFHKWA